MFDSYNYQRDIARATIPALSQNHPPGYQGECSLTVLRTDNMSIDALKLSSIKKPTLILQNNSVSHQYCVDLLQDLQVCAIFLRAGNNLSFSIEMMMIMVVQWSE